MRNKQLIYCLIGARGGSKDVPRKNILPINGHPLIAYSIAAAKSIGDIDRVIVSTDDEEIAGVARSYGAEVPFLRPKRYATDKSLDIEFFRHALEHFKQKERVLPDYIVHLRPTIPVRDVKVLRKAIRIMLKDKEATAVRSAHKVSPPAFKMFRLDGPYCKFFGHELFGENEEFFNYLRQRLPATYHVNGYIDVIRTADFKKSGMLYGKRIRAFLTEPSPDIDKPEDIARVRAALNKAKGIIDYKYMTALKKRHG